MGTCRVVNIIHRNNNKKKVPRIEKFRSMGGINNIATLSYNLNQFLIGKVRL